MPNTSMAHTPNTPMCLETLFKPLGPIGVSGAVTATGVVALGVEPIGVWITPEFRCHCQSINKS